MDQRHTADQEYPALVNTTMRWLSKQSSVSDPSCCFVLFCFVFFVFCFVCFSCVHTLHDKHVHVLAESTSSCQVKICGVVGFCGVAWGNVVQCGYCGVCLVFFSLCGVLWGVWWLIWFTSRFSLDDGYLKWLNEVTSLLFGFALSRFWANAELN